MQLEEARESSQKHAPQNVVIVADMTFHKKTFGVCVLRSPHIKQNLCWKFARTETASIYHECRIELEKIGYKIQAAVIDGKQGVASVFWDMPVQLCQFHQIKTVTRYLTTRPKLPAGQALRKLALKLTKSTEEGFSFELNRWHEDWKEFLKEKSFNPETRRCFYTHKRLRSAYRSLKTNIYYLFTYQRHPELNMPNTTNSLDGTFSHLKDLLRIHRGLNQKHKLKLINEILSKKSRAETA